MMNAPDVNLTSDSAAVFGYDRSAADPYITFIADRLPVLTHPRPRAPTPTL